MYVYVGRTRRRVQTPVQFIVLECAMSVQRYPTQLVLTEPCSVGASARTAVRHDGTREYVFLYTEESVDGEYFFTSTWLTRNQALELAAMLTAAAGAI